MRTTAAVFFLALSIAGLWLISRDHGFNLAHLLPSPDDKRVGVIQLAAPLVITLLTLCALSRLRGCGASSSDRRSSSSSRGRSAPGDASGNEQDDGGSDDSQEDDA